MPLSFALLALRLRMNLALENGDIAFDELGRLKTISGAAEVAQRIWVRLNTQAGEWSFDTSFGVDYLGQVFVKPARLQLIGALLRRAILDTTGVLRLRSFTIDIDLATRRLSVEFVAETTEGIIEAETVDADDGISTVLPMMFRYQGGVLWPHLGALGGV